MARSLNNLETQEEDLWNNALTLTKIKTIVRQYKPPGSDRVQMKVMKMLPKKAIIQLYYMYRACFGLGHFPAQWRVATIIPIKNRIKFQNTPQVTDQYV